MINECFKKIIKKSFLANFFYRIRYKYPNTRPKCSYSQTGEDLILNFFLKEKKSGFYVDVGAYHPIKLSNTYKFYKRGWNGINIEPNYNKFRLFEKQRVRDVNINLGIGLEKKQVPFFIFEVDTLSTFSKEIAEDYKRKGYKVAEIKNVDVVSLKSIFEKYSNNRKIDFLSVDTEGYDLEVLKTNDWSLFRPSFVILETVEYSENIFGEKLNNNYDIFMDNIGYKKIADTYINTIYIDKNFDIS